MWQALGASIEGVSHERRGIPCQDDHGKHLDGDYAIAVVADGLGSAAHAEAGARAAVRAALESVRQQLSAERDAALVDHERWLGAVFSDARRALEHEANALGVHCRELATTLLVAVVTPTCLVTGHLGDGAIVALRGDGTLVTVSAPERLEHANEVIPLTADDALQRVRVHAERACIDAVALLTDGMQALALNLASGAPYEPFFRPLFHIAREHDDPCAREHELAAFLRSPRVRERTADDVTLVLLGRRGEGSGSG